MSPKVKMCTCGAGNLRDDPKTWVALLWRLYEGWDGKKTGYATVILTLITCLVVAVGHDISVTGVGKEAINLVQHHVILSAATGLVVLGFRPTKRRVLRRKSDNK